MSKLLHAALKKVFFVGYWIWMWCNNFGVVRTQIGFVLIPTPSNFTGRVDEHLVTIDAHIECTRHGIITTTDQFVRILDFTHGDHKGYLIRTIQIWWLAYLYEYLIRKYGDEVVWSMDHPLHQVYEIRHSTHDRCINKLPRD